MSRYHFATAMMLASLVGLWGCGRAPSDGVSLEKLKTLEGKMYQLEDDFRTAASARDQLRRKLNLAEENQTKLQSQMDQFVKDLKERDEIIARRTSERDQMTAEFLQFRNNLRELLTKTEAALSKPESPTVPITPTSNKKPDEEKSPATPVAPVPPAPPSLELPPVPNLPVTPEK